MPSLLSDSEKAEMSSAIDDVHDTFAKDIVIYVKSPKVLSDTSNYNGYYDRVPNISKSQTSTELTPYTKKARIKFTKQDEKSLNFSSQMGLEASLGDVRLKVDLETAKLIENSVQVKVDEILFDNPTDAEPISSFSTKYFIIYLKRKN